MTQFDPWCSWLGIPPHEQPPTYYRLLGVPLFGIQSGRDCPGCRTADVPRPDVPGGPVCRGLPTSARPIGLRPGLSCSIRSRRRSTTSNWRRRWATARSDRWLRRHRRPGHSTPQGRTPGPCPGLMVRPRRRLWPPQEPMVRPAPPTMSAPGAYGSPAPAAMASPAAHGSPAPGPYGSPPTSPRRPLWPRRGLTPTPADMRVVRRPGPRRNTPRNIPCHQPPLLLRTDRA